MSQKIIIRAHMKNEISRLTIEVENTIEITETKEIRSLG